MRVPAHKINSKTVFFSIVVALAVGAVTPTPWSLVTGVQAIGAITAIPPRLDISLDPGKSVTTKLKVRNESEIQQLFTIDVQDFIVADSIGTPIPVSTTVSNRWSLKSWIDAPNIVPVDAFSTQEITITIKVPSKALPGGHYAMITYQPHGNIKPSELKTTGSIIAQRVGTLVYLSVNGPIKQDAKATKFATDKFLEKGPVDFAGTVQNLSDVHVNPKGTISIYNPLNQKVQDIAVETGNIFPEASRDFTASWAQKYGWGKYRADLNLAYGTAGGFVTASIFFWLFPIRLVIYSLIAIISILTIIILLNKRSKRHQEQLELEVAELKKEIEQIENK